MRHVVQAGLDGRAEYRFLAIKDMFPMQLMHWGLRHTYHDDWTYHGIDALGRFPTENCDPEREHYHHLALSDKDGRETSHFFGNKWDCESKTIETFFRDAGIPKCDLLVLDIEGWEVKVFQSYTGEIPIDYIIVEHHLPNLAEWTEPNAMEIDDFANLVESKGFYIDATLSEGGGARAQMFLIHRGLL